MLAFDERLDREETACALRPGSSGGARRRRGRAALLAAMGIGLLLGGCAHVAPPASSPPTADDALARMRATYACGHGVEGSAKIDHFGPRGRVRADLLLFAMRPASVRLDVVSPFGAALATLTSDGQLFELADLRSKVFYTGPASACNMARLTTVHVPGHVLVDVLRGEAPVLAHTSSGTSIVWDRHGYWVVTLASTRDASEQIHLAPRPADWNMPWEKQRMRVLDVRVSQQGFERYHVELSDHEPTPTAGPREDPDGLEPPIPPSGPPCDAEVPRKIHVEVPEPAADVRITYQQVVWNPPVPNGTFQQPEAPGMRVEPVTCQDPEASPPGSP